MGNINVMMTTTKLDRVIHRLSRIRFAADEQPNTDKEPTIHPVLHQASTWKEITNNWNANRSWKVTDPTGKQWHAKTTVENPEESHTDPAGRRVMRMLGFDEVPSAERVETATAPLVVSPWIEGQGTLRDHYHDVLGFSGHDGSLELENNLQGYGNKRLANLTTAHWLIHALDRNHGNYLISHDGQIHPMDYGETFSVLPWTARSDNYHMRDNRLSAPRGDALVSAASSLGLINYDHKLDPDFLERLAYHRPSIEHEFWHNVAPHLPAADALEAGRVLREKFAHLDYLRNLAKGTPQMAPSLHDLTQYTGMYAGSLPSDHYLAPSKPTVMA